MNERWKPVPRSIYHASNFGRIRNRFGRIVHPRNAARLVVMAWRGLRPGEAVYHRKGRSNRLNNLVVCLRRGETAPLHKLTAREVQSVVRLSNSMEHKAIAAHFGVTRDCITKILNGHAWGWLTGITRSNNDEK
jgi:hypothetical protein